MTPEVSQGSDHGGGRYSPTVHQNSSTAAARQEKELEQRERRQGERKNRAELHGLFSDCWI